MNDLLAHPKLTEQDWFQAAETLGVPVAALRAVSDVESGSCGFLSDGRAVILFERHIFWRRLKQHGLNPRLLARQSPDLVSRTPGGYQGGAAEYRRLAAAQQWHPVAALEATSWGAFQIMGYHWQTLNYHRIDDFIQQMQTSEADQLTVWVRYLQSQPALIHALNTQHWEDFAYGYNGPDYARHRYAAKLAHAWAKYAGGAAFPPPASA